MSRSPRKVAAPSETTAPEASSENATTGRRRVITYDWNMETATLTQSREKQPVNTFDFKLVCPDLLQRVGDNDIIMRLIGHGATQKIADSHAGDIPNAEANASEVFKAFVDGNWYLARGESAERSSMFVEAYVRLMRAKGRDVTIEQFRKIVNDIEGGNDDEKKRNLRAIRDSEEVTRAVNEIRLERAQAKSAAAAPVSLESLL